MKKILLLLVSFTFTISNLFSQNEDNPRHYIAYRTIDTIIIDGIADEESWTKTEFSQDFIDIGGIKTPEFQTNIKMLWDDSYLYFYAKMEEPHIWATLKQRDTVIFYNNDFEIFIDPDGDTHNYMEYEMNALNTIWDLFIVKPYREPAPIIDNWDIKGLRSAVYVEGSLNDSSNEDKYWSVEVAMPWKALEEANIYGKGHENKFWRINFSRVNWDFEVKDQTYSRKTDEQGNFLPEYNWVWSPQGVINMHEPEHWGYVFFSSETAGNTIQFEIPEDEKIRWIMFQLYRNQKSYHKEHGQWAQQLEKLIDKPLKINAKSIKPQLEIHQSGWNISVKSPFTGNSYIIKEDGQFLQI